MERSMGKQASKQQGKGKKQTQSDGRSLSQNPTPVFKIDKRARTLANKQRRILKDAHIKSAATHKKLIAHSYHDANTHTLDSLATMAFTTIAARKKSNKQRREQKFVEHVKFMKDLAASMFSIEARAHLKEAA
jgi:hypothetical protein